ncbi:hypothetical protein GDO78_002944 [Eleutherodactylus coqui]|uniref:Uncharacterized protein n=1 Tax=Eleutherodactylus coqui TaxID=57060 RepID=A0A8J6K1J4_ELECQ|nr:hypothetical protein GDO78_002944 [Eleutherodactylus coqui]
MTCNRCALKFVTFPITRQNLIDEEKNGHGFQRNILLVKLFKKQLENGTKYSKFMSANSRCRFDFLTISPKLSNLGYSYTETFGSTID